MAEASDKPKVWKHIGLYGHAVGTFSGKKIRWEMIGESLVIAEK